MKYRRSALLASIVLSLVASGVSAFGAGATARVAPQEAQKTRIAVASFAPNASMPELNPQQLENLITNSLVNEGNFDVVSRSQLDKVLAEQRLSNSDLVNPKEAAAVGRLLGAKFIVTGAIHGAEVKLNLFGKDKAVVKAQLQLIEVSTGSLVVSETFEGTFSGFALERTSDGRNVTENAKQKVYNECAPQIAKLFTDRVNQMSPVEGYVVEVENGQVILNVGSANGAKVGQEYLVFTDGRVIKDPVTGKVLSTTKKNAARLIVKTVEANLSYADVVATYSPAATVTVGTEKVDLTPDLSLIKPAMTVVQTTSRAAEINKELEKARKGKK